jgi:hypothetical protein
LIRHIRPFCILATLLVLEQENVGVTFMVPHMLFGYCAVSKSGSLYPINVDFVNHLTHLLARYLCLSIVEIIARTYILPTELKAMWSPIPNPIPCKSMCLILNIYSLTSLLRMKYIIEPWSFRWLLFKLCIISPRSIQKGSMKCVTSSMDGSLGPGIMRDSK